MENEPKKDLAMGKTNLILAAAAFVLVLVGIALMAGPASQTEYNPDIYSTRRTVVAPVVAFCGFVMMIFAILKKTK